MKKLKILIPTTLVATSLPFVSFVSCNDKKDPEIVKHTITWDTNNADAILSITPATIEVEDNIELKDVDKPEYETAIGFRRADDKWYSDYNCINEIDSTTHITSDIKIYAKFEPIPEYTITWGGDDAAVESIEPSSIEVFEGTKLADVEKPTYTLHNGYRRVGNDVWYSDSTCTNPIDPTTEINETQTIYAKFEPIPRYTITWGGDGVAVESIVPSSIEVFEGTKLADVAKPTYKLHNGYRRVGNDVWYSDSACTNPIDPITEINETQTIYAKFEPIPQYTITWSVNDDNAVKSIVPSSIEVFEGTKLTNVEKPTYTPNEGYRRVGNDVWYSDSACTNPIDPITEINETQTIYAKFEPIPKCKITWSANNVNAVKSIEPSSIEVFEGTKLADVEKPTYTPNEGYVRADNKWYSDSACKKEITSTTQIKSSQTIYAKFGEYTPVEQIIINNGEEASVIKGYTLTLTLSTVPYYSLDSFDWSSDNDSIATVDGNGVVTPVNTGTTTIRVKSHSNPEVNASCQVTVKENTPLCFEKDGGTGEDDPTISYQLVSLTRNSIQYTYDLQDKDSWKKWNAGTPLTIDDGKKLYVRNLDNELSTWRDYYFQFVMNGQIKSSGNVDSLINYSTPSVYCYAHLFEGCSGLTTAPDLPSTQLTKKDCYLMMFKDCASLKVAPELNATNLSEEAYCQMFQNTGLEKAPHLPATSLEQYCYWNMFMDCKALTTVPLLPAMNLQQGCYSSMFCGCSNLNSVKVGFGKKDSADWPNGTSNWLEKVANTGTFIWNGSLSGPEVKYYSTVPSGWTIQNW